MHREFWSMLFGHTQNSWLDETISTITFATYHRRFEAERHTIIPPKFLVCHLLEDGNDWRAFMSGIATYPDIMVPWWDVDRVYMLIHSYPNHWLFGELRLESIEVHLYDSLGRGTFENFELDGTLSKFEAWVAKFLDKTNYWKRRNIPKRPLNMTFTLEDSVPQQSSVLGDCVVFVCMFMEQLVSGQPIHEFMDPKNADLEFRQRMDKIYWGSCVGPMWLDVIYSYLP
uniref:Ubiquitin-like protease family profile domain-containing protein n=1 Tax=Lactuca sativa TaxID=4236 RepID=A0A9R1XUF5_LACSA|nr:hypothetical protein LSAT_V11C200066430 [Lactuca sativa]